MADREVEAGEDRRHLLRGDGVCGAWWQRRWLGTTATTAGLR